MSSSDTPFRLLDPSGRSLIWVKINSKRAHTEINFYESDECRIILCPRSEGPDWSQDLHRPCHRESADGFFRLRDEVHEWLEVMGLGSRYQFEFRFANNDPKPGWHVGFYTRDSAIAALFKLTWGSDE